MGSLIWNLISLMKLIKVCSVFDFSLKKNSHVKWVWSSTMTRMYFLWCRITIVERPHRSIWSNSKGSVMEESSIKGWIPLVCLLHSQAVHKVSFSNLRRGNPYTISLVTNLLMYQKLRWSSILCHSHLTSETTFDKKHSCGLPMTKYMYNGNTVPIVFDLIRHLDLSFIIM